MPPPPPQPLLLAARHQQHAAEQRARQRGASLRVAARAAAPEAPSTATSSMDDAGRKGRSGASGIGSGIKLENVSRRRRRAGVLCGAAGAGAGAAVDAHAACCAAPRPHRAPTLPPTPPPLQVSITFKNQQVLRDISWDVKKGERVGLVGVNGAGKTTQLQIITGALTPDSGEVIKAREDMRIAYLTQVGGGGGAGGWGVGVGCEQCG